MNQPTTALRDTLANEVEAHSALINHGAPHPQAAEWLREYAKVIADAQIAALEADGWIVQREWYCDDEWLPCVSCPPPVGQSVRHRTAVYGPTAWESRTVLTGPSTREDA